MAKKTIQPRMNSIYRILILSLLNDEPRSGYDLIQCLEGILGNKPSHGKVYPFLNELLQFNLISIKDVECDLRSKVVYKLTSNGNDLLINTLGNLEYIFLNFLSSCSHCGTKFYSSSLQTSPSDDSFCCPCCEPVNVPRR